VEWTGKDKKLWWVVKCGGKEGRMRTTHASMRMRTRPVQAKDHQPAARQAEDAEHGVDAPCCAMEVLNDAGWACPQGRRAALLLEVAPFIPWSIPVKPTTQHQAHEQRPPSRSRAYSCVESTCAGPAPRLPCVCVGLVGRVRSLRLDRDKKRCREEAGFRVVGASNPWPQ